MSAPNRRILVVDDNPAIHEDLRKILAPEAPSALLTGLEDRLFGKAPPTFEKCQVDSALQGEEGIEKARAARLAGRPYALALIDMRMPPGIDGLRTIEAIWRCDHEIHIVVCTAYSDASWEDLFARFGASDRLLFLKKPFDTAEVCQLASSLIEKWRLSRSVQAQVDELRTQRQELARQVAFAHAIQEAVGDGLLVIDESGKIIERNRRLTELWNFSETMFGAGDDRVLLDHAVGLLLDPEEFLARVFFLYENREAVSTDELRLKDGRVFERWSGPVRSAEGRFLGRVWSFKDITLRRKAESERAVLTERLASLGRLTATVGHEINNPLAYALGNVAYLLEKFDPGRGTFSCSSGDVSEVLQTTQSGLSRIGVIVRDLQILSRPEDVVSEVDLHALVEQSLQVAMNEIRHRARITRNYRSIPVVTGNAARLGQVFLNLILNAAQAIPEGRVSDNEISIAMAGRGDTVTVEISDTGGGIADEHLARIFEPFFTTKAIGSGTGLGLSVCQGIVTAHGGTISVRSSLGRGTTFTVTLPAGLPTPTPPPSPPSREPVKTGHIVIIDDDRDILRTLERTLHGHEIVTFGKAREAMAWLKSGKHADVILCDLMMAEYTGMDFHADLARERPDVASRVVFMTGGAFTLHAQQYVAAVPNPCVAKPFDVPALKRMIAERMA
ncbi:MAG TPA: ATP-binding protein [Polyangia bacterium]|jgi:signal transduction histidine kinase